MTTRLLSAFTACCALVLLTAPMALADDDHGRAGDRDDHAAGVQDQRGPRADRDRDADDTAGNVRATALVMAINNDVAMLSNVDLDNDNGVLDVDHVQTVSLSALETGLPAGQASAVSTAVNNTTAALQSFLGNGSASANAVDAALNAAGVSPSSVLAIVPMRDDGLLVVTA